MARSQPEAAHCPARQGQQVAQASRLAHKNAMLKDQAGAGPRITRTHAHSVPGSLWQQAHSRAGLPSGTVKCTGLSKQCLKACPAVCSAHEQAGGVCLSLAWVSTFPPGQRHRAPDPLVRVSKAQRTLPLMRVACHPAGSCYAPQQSRMRGRPGQTTRMPAAGPSGRLTPAPQPC